MFNRGLAAAKTFPIWKERTRLQFRADFFNLFNHTNFANPVHDESNANFGKITQTLGTAVATSVGTLTAGSLAETKESGRRLRQHPRGSTQEAIERTKYFLQVPGGSETEIRQLYEAPAAASRTR